MPKQNDNHHDHAAAQTKGKSSPPNILAKRCSKNNIYQRRAATDAKQFETLWEIQQEAKYNLNCPCYSVQESMVQRELPQSLREIKQTK